MRLSGFSLLAAGTISALAWNTAADATAITTVPSLPSTYSWNYSAGLASFTGAPPVASSYVYSSPRYGWGEWAGPVDAGGLLYPPSGGSYPITLSTMVAENAIALPGHVIASLTADCLNCNRFDTSYPPISAEVGASTTYPVELLGPSTNGVPILVDFLVGVGATIVNDHTTIEGSVDITGLYGGEGTGWADAASTVWAPGDVNPTGVYDIQVKELPNNPFYVTLRASVFTNIPGYDTGFAWIGNDSDLYMAPDILDGANASISVDPLISIDPSFASVDPNYLSDYTIDTFGVPNSLSSSLPAAVPEPATWAMMLLGFGAIGFARRRKSAEGLAV